MKTKILLFLTALMISLAGLYAQSSEYEKAMISTIAKLEEAKTADDYIAIANTFDRISAQNPKEIWPSYYSSYALIHNGFYLKELEKRDAIFDKVLAQLKKAQEMDPNNDELQVLQGYALMGKMIGDPATRGQKYSPMVAQSYGKALSMNPSNPRALAMMARWELGTAQYFGTKPTKSCGMAQGSLAIFKNAKMEGIKPSWGKDVAEEVLAACNE